MRWVPVAAWAAWLLGGCDDESVKAGGQKAAPPSASAVAPASPTASSQGTAQPSASAEAKPSSLDERCEKLGKACGEKDKHQETITKECKEAARAQVDKGCTTEVLAAYDCYEKELCAKEQRIWALDDFRVLSQRHEKCVAERKASVKCLTGKDEGE